MNRYVKFIENNNIKHKLKLTKIKSRNGNVKAICFAEEPFVFKIENFCVKEVSKTGFISIYTKNNMHRRLGSIYQVFSEIENQIINIIFNNRYEWCNNMNIPRYHFEEAFHQPIKIKNNETIISCHYDNNLGFESISSISEKKKLASFTIEYEGFELNESDILPLFKVSHVVEKESKFSSCLQENSSSEENTMEMDIYPTDIEQLPAPIAGKKSAPEIPVEPLVDFENKTQESEYFNSETVFEQSETKETNKSISTEMDETSITFSDYSQLSAKINTINKTIKNAFSNYKQKNSSSFPTFVSNLEFAKIKNSSELNKIYLDTIEDGYESQFEKIKKIKVKK